MKHVSRLLFQNVEEVPKPLQTGHGRDQACKDLSRCGLPGFYTMVKMEKLEMPDALCPMPYALGPRP
jgi:hypothetical protein